MTDSSKRLRIVPSDERDPIERLAGGDSAGVIEDLQRLLAADPNDEVSWLRLGAVYLAIGHAPEAETALARAVELDGDDVEARLLYADVLARVGKLDAAAFQLVQARRHEPGDARIHRQLGVVFLEKGLHEKAEASLATASEIDPTDPKVPFLRGLVADACKDPARALVFYRKAVELDPNGVDARCTLADAMAAMGELAEAVASLEAAQRLDRSNTRIAQNLEVLRRALRDLESHRLVGKGEAEFERSALVVHGQLKRAGHVDLGEEAFTRYRSPLVEAWVRYEGDRIAALLAVLPDPARAANTVGDAFDVTVVGRTGAPQRADLATAATLTFLREALGCPMTRASELYARLLQKPEPFVFAGVRLEWREVEIAAAKSFGLQATRVAT